LIDRSTKKPIFGTPVNSRRFAGESSDELQMADATVIGQPDDDAVAGFLRAVGTGQIDTVRDLLRATPALTNAVGPHPFWGGRPQALHVAIETKQRDVFDLLLDRGADVNGSNDAYDRWSPLMLAVHRDRPDMRDDLLARGAHVGLFEALLLADDDRVDALLRADGVPVATPSQASPIAFARTPFAIDRLLALGASPTARDRWGTTPIATMSRLGVRGAALLRHMVGRGVPAGPEEYARLGDRTTLARLVDEDPAIATRDAVLLSAVDAGHHDVVGWLLDHGARANARADGGSRHTALHAAAWNGDVAMVRLLLAAGADATARDHEHDATPLGWADTAGIVTNNPRCAEVVAVLAQPPHHRELP
jgi:ankyrin repeat protein